MATPEETRRLLSAVERATNAAEKKREAAREAAVKRGDAVQAAMDAGIPRDEIARSARVHRNLLYRLIGKASGK